MKPCRVKPYLYQKPLKMPRKRWTHKPEEEITPELLRFREKRKWQIALRRYVINRNPSNAYAPFFGLDINTLREWFESQFSEEMTWDNFGSIWQFEHVIPVVFFDFGDDQDLKLCWHFTNLRAESIQVAKIKGARVDLAAARNYFSTLEAHTGLGLFQQYMKKLELIETSSGHSLDKQFEFLNRYKNYLDQIGHYSEFEFDLLNRGRTAQQVEEELLELKKIKL